MKLNNCLLSLFLTSAISCLGADAKVNFVFLESDDHHFQALGCMGEPLKTPNLDRLAARGVLFRHNVSQGTMCSPSRNALLTGSYPHNTGVYHNADGNMPKGIWTLPGALQRAGYQTALIGKNHFKPPSPYTGRPGQKPAEMILQETRKLGFDYLHSVGGKVAAASGPRANQTETDPYRLYLRDKGLLEKYEQEHSTPEADANSRIKMKVSVLQEEDYQDAYTARQAAEWIRTNHSIKPFFLWVDFVDPHPPAHPPLPYAGMYDWKTMRAPLPRPNTAEPVRGALRGVTDEQFKRFRAEYYAMITCLDAQIGKVLKALEECGELENTVIVFAGDQGSMLGDHGLWGKGKFYKGSINSPLIIAGTPGSLRGAKIDRPVELIDVAPTVLELAKIGTPERARCFGHSLLPLLTGQGVYGRSAAFAEDAEDKMVVNERYKFVRSRTEPLLFDMQADPDELNNLIGKLPQVEKEMGKLLDDWLAATPPVRKANPSPVRKTVAK